MALSKPTLRTPLLGIPSLTIPPLTPVGAGATSFPASLFTGDITVGGYYDIQDTATIKRDFAGTILATPGDSVSRVDAGVGLDLTQNATSNKPTLRLFNGVYYLEFDGVDDKMSATGAARIPALPYTVGIAFILEQSTGHIAASSGAGDVNVETSSDELVLDGGVAYSTGQDLTVGAFHYLIAEFNGAASKLYLDGTLIGEDFNTGTERPRGFRLGTDLTASTHTNILTFRAFSVEKSLSVSEISSANSWLNVAPAFPSNLYMGSREGGIFDIQDISTMYQDAAGTTPAVVDAAVGRVEDQSGNGNHLTQSTTAAKPTLRLDSGTYYLEFDGVDDFLTVTFGSTLAQPNTVVIDYQTADNDKYIFDGTDGSNRNALFFGGQRFFAGATQIGTATVVDTRRTITAVYNNTDSDKFLDGTIEQDGVNVGSQGIAGFNLFARQDDGELSEGRVYRLCIYNGLLPTSKREAVETWAGQ